jgi:ATP/maltotriose-dependent transcriptional regulator MalT
VSQHQDAVIVAQAQRALEFLRPANLPVRTATTWALGYAYELQGNRSAARQSYTAAVAAAEAIGHFIMHLMSTLGIAHMQEADNQLAQAAAIVSRGAEAGRRPAAARRGRGASWPGAAALRVERPGRRRRARAAEPAPGAATGRTPTGATRRMGSARGPRPCWARRWPWPSPAASCAPSWTKDRRWRSCWLTPLPALSCRNTLPRLLAAFAADAPQPDDKPRPPALTRAQPLIEPLSERELEVLRLIADGLSNQEIGERLFLALDTVKGHNRHIFDKLQVQRRTEAVARARELGLI